MKPEMREILDLDRYPIDHLDSPDGHALVARCRADLASDGMFNLDRLVRPHVIARCAAELQPRLDRESYTHERSHNVYFLRNVAGLSPDHPALRQVVTVHHTLCADQIQDSVVTRIYEWAPFVEFLASVMERPKLHVMEDSLARVNVIAYRAGEVLNWHFDRSQFTTTLLIQAPESGGEFEYRRDLRSETDPNYEGVARLLRGEDAAVRSLTLQSGTLNVFKGKNTLHRIAPPAGGRDRIVAIFSYYDQPGVVFSEAERVGFYGRAK